MILKFIENDGVSGARLTIGEKPIPDGSFLYRDGRYIRGGELGTIPAFASHRHANETLQHIGVNSIGGAFAFTTTGAVTFNQAINAATGSTIGNLTLANGSVTDSSGAISFGNENLTTSGSLTLSSLTQGSVPFIGSGGLITQDNSNLFWDNINKSLGIGTSSPGNVELKVYNSTQHCAIWCQSVATSRQADIACKSSTALFILTAYGSAVGGTFAGLSKNSMSLFEGQACSSLVFSTVNSGTAPIVFAPGRIEKHRITSGGDWQAAAGVDIDCYTNGAYLKPRRVSQSAIPTPDANELMIWRDSDDSKTYLVYNDVDEGVRSVEMT